MSFLSSLFGSSKVFRPWADAYFAQRLARSAVLKSARPLRIKNGYEVIEEHEGGMGRVLIARNENGLVAMKELKELDLSPDASDRLADEASKLIGLDPFLHLVPIDIVPEFLTQSCTIILPYCAGGSLADRVQGSRLEPAELIYYALTLATELRELHSFGLLHLDLKPANILLQRSEEKNKMFAWKPVVADYGLSLYREVNRPVPSSGGTPLFMAPEQFRGLAVESHTDVWGFAATIYYLAVGHSPLQGLWPLKGESLKVVPLHALRTDVPTWFSDLVGRCLDLTPSSRMQNFDEVLTSLLSYVRVERATKGKFNGYAGPSKSAAELIIQDDYAMMSLNKIGLTRDDGMVARIDLGWVTRLREAETLFKTYRAGPSRKGLGILDSILGDWDDSASLLGRFEANPSQQNFELSNIRVPNERGAYSVNPPVPLTVVWQMLDLRCRLLATVGEEQALPVEVASFVAHASRWYATGSLGLPTKDAPPGVLPRGKALNRIAQGFRFAGDFERAVDLLKEARNDDAADLGTVIVLAFCLRDLRRYDEALDELKRGVELCFRQKNREMYYLVGMSMGETRLRQGDLPLAALTFRQLHEQFESAQFLIGQRLSEARMAGSVTDKSILQLAETLLVPGVSPDMILWISDLYRLAGQKSRSVELAKAALRGPAMRLPAWSYYRAMASALAHPGPSGSSR